METEVREIRPGITIIHGDCMEVMKRYGENEFDLAVADPPYFEGPNKRVFYGRKSPITGRRKEYHQIEKWDIPGHKYFDECCWVSVNQIIWGINYFEFSGRVVGRIVWDKVNGNSDFSDCELASWSGAKSVRKFDFMWNGMIQAKSVSEGRVMQGNKKLNETRIHPTQKPVALYRWIYANYATLGMKILDTHLGSGSNAIAAYYAGMEFTGIELDRDYFEAACKRIERETRQMQLFEPATKRETGNQMSILDL